MYVPTHFSEERPEVLHGLITEHPLGTMVLMGDGELVANHLPFEHHLEPGPNGTEPIYGRDVEGDCGYRNTRDQDRREVEGKPEPFAGRSSRRGCWNARIKQTERKNDGRISSPT